MRNVRRIGIGVISATLLVISADSASAHGGHPSPDNFGGKSPIIVNDYGEHYVNSNNPEVRWDWRCHQFAVPGQGDEQATQDHAAIIDRPGTNSGLVAPGDKSIACT